MEVIEKLCQISYDSSSSRDDEESLTRVPRNDSSERLKGGCQHHKQALFPATDKKFSPRCCKVCQKSGIRKDTRVFCKKCIVLLC